MALPAASGSRAVFSRQRTPDGRCREIRRLAPGRAIHYRVMHEAMDAKTVAELLDVGERRLRDYVAMGMPSQQQGRTRTFVWPEARDWWADNIRAGAGPATRRTAPTAAEPDAAEDITAATLRKTTAEADLKELALSTKRGEVITLADAKPRLDRLFTNLRSKALSLAPRLANLLEGARDRAARETVIREQMETLCRELSTGEVLGLPTLPDDPETEPGTVDALSAAAERSQDAPIDLTWYQDPDASHQ